MGYVREVQGEATKYNQISNLSWHTFRLHGLQLIDASGMQDKSQATELLLFMV